MPRHPLHSLLRASSVVALAAAALAGPLAPADAATAHNSQAGSWGPTTHNCAPTPYFPAGGCASTIIRGEGLFPPDVPSERYRPGRRLTYPGAVADPFDR